MDSILDLDAQIADVQAHIDELTLRRCALQARRNALTPLCRVPSDVMFRILDFVVHAGFKDAFEQPDMPFQFSETEEIYGEPANWMPLASICSQVREIAITSPLLWNHLDLGWPPLWVELCLERSSGPSLHLNLCGEIPEANEVHVEALLPRAREIHSLQPTQVLYGDTFCTSLGEALPELRSLVYLPGSKYRFSLLSSFLFGETASLTQLVLHGVSLDESAALLHFPSLLAFDFCGRLLQPYEAVVESDPENDVERLLQLLSRAPRLERLCIQNVTCDDFDFEADQDTVFLPRLSLLTIHDARLQSVLALCLRLPTPHQACRLVTYYDSFGNDPVPREIISLHEHAVRAAGLDLPAASRFARFWVREETPDWKFRLVFEHAECVPHVKLTVNCDWWQDLRGPVNVLGKKGFVFEKFPIDFEEDWAVV